MRSAQKSLWAADLNKAKTRLSELEALVQLKVRVIAIFSEFVDGLWTETKELIEQVVTRGIQVCFDDSLEVKVRVEMRKNQITAEPYLLVDKEERDLLTGEGGGLSDAVSMLLRIAILLLKRPSHARIIILDEPMKHMSAGHVPLIVDFLQTLSDAFGIQLIIATHIEDFKRVGTHYQVTMVEKKTQATLMEAVAK